VEEGRGHPLRALIQVSTLTSARVSNLLAKLYADAENADKPFHEKMEAMTETERKAVYLDTRRMYGDLARNAYLPIPPDFGRLLYMLICSSKARTIVEFGTSFGISTIHLAAAVRDNGSGHVIATEYEPSKAAQARKNLEAAGLAELVEIRIGDALETLRSGIESPIDLVLLDGPKNLYLPALRLIEARLAPRAWVAADNTKNLAGPMADYLAYVRTPANGYVSADIPSEPGHEVSLRIE
jgi:predicted O-methyltransferase YrrM